MPFINLTAQERERFSVWLMQEAEIENKLSEQVKKLGPGQDVMVRRMKQQAIAMVLVARRLADVETMSLGAEEAAEGE